MSDPIVSAIIVNYESAGDLERCLRALGGQRGAGLEAIAIDHSASDDLRGIDERFPWVRVARQRNAGFAAGVNRGAAMARGKYLLVLNPDVVVGDGAVDTLARWMDLNPAVAVAGPRILDKDGSLEHSARRFPDLSTALAGRSAWLTRRLPRNPLSRRNLAASWATEPVETDWVSGACMMIRADAFREVGGMDEGFFLYWEDADLCRRLRARGWRTAYVPDAQAVHLGGRSSRAAPLRAAVAFHCSVLRYYVKHGGRAAKLATPLVVLALSLRLLTRLPSIAVQKLSDRGG
ncbi:MAG TPA: glycosyltransferase family 2 protein [Vicinamibacterales bacterium]|nr:glycosyltransferase family 2 protein [Vicinamibacterales bacterium]